MKTKTFILIAICLFSLVLINACLKEISIKEVKACEFDSDCIMVFDVGCCKCQTTINSEYQEYWNKLDKREMKKCEGVICEPCGPSKAIDAECVNNTCTILYSGVGI